MAKKGGVQQLQTEVNTNEELEKFLSRPGLLILDVYTEWCGPCLAMVGSLKKVKLEHGGDDLHLAIVKSDYIDVFERFRNKSEPTWIFASNGKVVNCAFGSNVPELMSLIITELDNERKYRNEPYDRKFYELTEMCPVELERHNVKLALEEETIRIEKEAAERKRNQYITFVTDEIMNRAGDMGVTLQFPHTLGRDLLKKLIEQADKFGLIAKDKKTIKITKDDFKIIHFECVNPLDTIVIDHILGKDVFLVCWKTADGELRAVEEILIEFTQLISGPTFHVDDFGQPTESQPRIPPVLRSLEILVKKENETNKSEASIKSNEKLSDTSAAPKTSSTSATEPNDNAENEKVTDEKTTTTDEQEQPADDSNENNAAENTDDSKTEEVINNIEAANEDVTNDEKSANETEPTATNNAETANDIAKNNESSTEKPTENPDEPSDIKNKTENAEAKTDNEETKNKENHPPEENQKLPDKEQNHDSENKEENKDDTINKSTENLPEKNSNSSVTEILSQQSKSITSEEGEPYHIPPVWTPFNKRANAALIYLYFRQLTDHFLAPDPLPDPPHLAMAFEAYKRKNITEIMDQFPDDILAYGYFSSDDPENTELLANSNAAYDKKIPTTNDKMVLKVAKKTSHTLLNLVTHGPCFISLNTEAGKTDCLAFFPDGYTQQSEEVLEEEEEPKEMKKKRTKKGRKGAKQKEGSEKDDKDDKEDEDFGDENDEDDEGEQDDLDDTGDIQSVLNPDCPIK